jgi:antitoxin PrlF
MKTNIIVSSRGQVTLPSEMRKKYKIDEGSVLVAEERDGAIVLRPAAVMELEYYTDEHVKKFVAADTFKSKTEEKALRAKLIKLSKKK